MTRRAWALVALAAVAVLEAVYLYGTASWMGFPDGHLTALERMRRTTFPVYITLDLAAAGAAVTLARAGVKQMTFYWLLAAFLAAHGAAFALDRVLGAGLEDGSGG